MIGEADWLDALGPEELGDVLRSALRAEYADASDEEMGNALGNVLDSMSPAEGSGFLSALGSIGSALGSVGKSASRALSDPAFVQVVRTAAPIVGKTLGTMIGGPTGTAVGSQLGNLAASALPAPSRPRAMPVAPPPPAVPVAPAPVSRAAVPRPPGPLSPAAAPLAAAAPAAATVASQPGSVSPAADGSVAAAQALVLTQHGDILQSLLSTALGRHGCQRVNGVHPAELLALFSQVVGQAAADADELMYLEQQADATQSVLEASPAGSGRLLYADLLGAGNLELAEAAGWEGLD